jgi:hypothetical protein
MNLQGYHHRLVARILAYDLPIFNSLIHGVFHVDLGSQWIFPDPFSRGSFSACLLTVRTNSTTDIFSSAFSNSSVKLRRFRSKTLNENLFTSGSALSFFLEGTLSKQWNKNPWLIIGDVEYSLDCWAYSSFSGTWKTARLSLPFI